MTELSPGLIGSLVPRDKIASLWPQAAPLIEPALEVAPGRFSLEDILNELNHGTQSLWVILKKNEVIAAFTTKIYETPQCRICSIEWFGGTEMDSWIEGIRVVENFARDCGCRKIEAHGRRGWVKVLRDKGYSLNFQSHEKILG